MVRLTLIVLSLALTVSCAAAQQAAGENPRDRVFAHPVIEYISISPRQEVREIGDQPRRPDGAARMTAHLMNCSTEEETVEVVWPPACGAERDQRKLLPGERVEVSREVLSADIPYGDSVALFVRSDDAVPANAKAVARDIALVHHERAMRIGLVIESRTMKAGDESFGSFTRRMHLSFEDLHAEFARKSETAGGAEREPITDRFRIEHVEVFERGENPPPLFTEHPDLDLVIACDEDGPLAGFWLPEYSIGHNFTGAQGGLWGTAGEQALWHELMHFRGVPDYYIYRIEARSLPGRLTDEYALPEVYRRDLMNDPYGEVVISWLTARIANSKAGIARVGACEETDHPFGHQWNWIPGELRVTVRDGTSPAAGATARWWRSMFARFQDGRVQAVLAGRAADGSAMLDSAGGCVVGGDYMGREQPRRDRSLWLLLEVERGGEKRFAVVPGLQLNELYARGATERAEIALDWGAMSMAAAPMAGDGAGAEAPVP